MPTPPVGGSCGRAYRRGGPSGVPRERHGVDAIVVIPSIAAWNCGWLGIGEQLERNGKVERLSP